MISVGFPVITASNATVGRITKVYKNFSIVSLITGKKQTHFDAKIGTDIDCLVKGQGNLNLTLDLVSKDKTIEPGMIISTSALGGIFPKGLLVGTVGVIEKSDAAMFQQATVNTAFDITRLDTVFIIMGYRFTDGTPNESDMKVLNAPTQ